MTSKACRLAATTFRLTCAIVGSLSLAACQTTPAPVTITVPTFLRAECDRPDPAGVQTVGDLAAFSVRQDAALRACDGRRGAVVELIDAHAKAVTPEPWWRVWR